MQILSQHVSIPLIVSLSLSGAGIIIYFLNKKEVENQRKAIKNDAEQSLAIIKIPHRFIPIIVGKAGSVIQSIQRSTNTKITFEEENSGVFEQACTIIGISENIAIAQEQINNVLENQIVIETYETWVPQSTAKKFSQKDEKLLNQIQNSSNAKIILENLLISPNFDTEVRVIIKGTTEQITNALLKIKDEVRQDSNKHNRICASSIKNKSKIENSTVTYNNSPNNIQYLREIFGDESTDNIFEVFVCAVNSPNQFYVQVIGSTNELLDDLIKDMSKYYTTEQNKNVHILDNISVGQIVAVQFDNKVYRGKIVADLGNHTYDIYFVDFGDQETIDSKNIFHLLPNFLKLRLQAIECSLAGIEPCGKTWNSEACEIFSQMCAVGDWRPRYANVKKYERRIQRFGFCRSQNLPVACIFLYVKRDNQFIDIGKELINLGLARVRIQPQLETNLASPTLFRNLNTQNPYLRPPSNKNGLIEVNDLTITPKKIKLKRDEAVDLSTPVSRRFIQGENNASQINSHKMYLTNMQENSLKETTTSSVVNIIPAGYESEDSDEDDGFEIN